MTRENDDIQEVMATVFIFDICSSTDILEDLHRTGNVKIWRDLLILLKEFLIKEADEFPFKLYKFTGDGWILLFDYDLNGKRLLSFRQRLCITFDSLYRQKILPILETPPNVVGVTMGMDRGRLIKIQMNKQDEYVGRPLNVACRLQSAIKDIDSAPANKMLMTKPLYDSIKQDVISWKFYEVTRTLRNIAGGKELHCIKLANLEPRKRKERK